jgi:hypothetical protein
MKAKKYRLLVVLGVIICGISWCAGAAKSERNSLVGLEGVGVVIRELPPEADSYWLTKEQLESQVKRHLRRHGIAVLDEKERLRRAGRPHLYVVVNPLITEGYNICAVSYDISLRQDVWLARDHLKKCRATTWNRSAVSLTGTGILADGVKKNLRLYLNEFVRAYLTVNPRQPAKEERPSSLEDLFDDLLDGLLDGNTPQ